MINFLPLRRYKLHNETLGLKKVLEECIMQQVFLSLLHIQQANSSSDRPELQGQNLWKHMDILRPEQMSIGTMFSLILLFQIFHQDKWFNNKVITLFIRNCPKEQTSLRLLTILLIRQKAQINNGWSRKSKDQNTTDCLWTHKNFIKT